MADYFIKQTKNQDNALCVLKNLIHLIGVKITSSSINRTAHHPDYPGLSSLSDSLSDWRIENLGVKINLEQLQKIPLPAIAHLNKNNGHFVVLSKVENNSLQYIDPETGWVNENLRDFESKWSGVALLVSANETSGEKDYKQKRKLEIAGRAKRIMWVVLAASLLIISAFFAFKTSFFITWIILLLIKTAGLGFSVVLLFKQFGKNNYFVNKVCKATKSFDCNNILNSPASNLFGVVSMSELGMLYFAGGVLSLLLTSITSTPTFGVLFIFCIATLPYSVFSIYYQQRVVRYWCLFCLAVMLLFWFEFFILFYETGFSIASSELLTCFVGFVIPVIIWLLFRDSIVKAHSVEGLVRLVSKFMYNSNIFNALLEKQPFVEFKDFTHEIILGKESASTIITIVSNPVCGLCSFAHLELDDLLMRYPDQLKVKVRFFVNPSKSGSVDYKVSKEILRKAISGNNKSVNDALHSWFNSKEKNVTKWATLIGNTGETGNEVMVDELFKSHYNWCTTIGISMTPTFFLNNKKLPEEYSVTDLKYHIRQLIGRN